MSKKKQEALAGSIPEPLLGASLVASNSRKPKAQGAEWSPGREADPEDPVAGLIARTFDYILIHATSIADGRGGITFERYAEISSEFVAFMEEQPQEYIEAVEPAYIVATQCKSVDEFLDIVSVQRLYCYRALLPLLGDVDPLLPDADPEEAGCFFDLVRELRASPKRLLEVLWRGRWRHAKFWGQEFRALRREMGNARKQEKRVRAKERKYFPEYLASAFHQMQDVESEEPPMGAMELALYRLSKQDADTKPHLTLKKGAWEEAGKRIGLKLTARKLLAKRARGGVRRNRNNNADWEMIRSKFPQLASVLRTMIEEEKLVDRYAHPLISERVDGKTIIFGYKGIAGN